MKLCRCPVCHSTLHLDALVQDQAGRELIATVARLDTRTATVLLGYLGLFRPFKSDLNNGRALKLLTETLSLTPNVKALCQALEQTVSNISQNRREGSDTKPLSNHNYLKKVLCSLPGWDLSENQYHEISQPVSQQPARNVSQSLLNINDTGWSDD